MQVIPFDQLSRAALHIDATYEGSRHGNAGDDPLLDLLGVSIQGGFRFLKEKGINSLHALTAWLDALGRKPNVRSS